MPGVKFLRSAVSALIVVTTVFTGAAPVARAETAVSHPTFPMTSSATTVALAYTHGCYLTRGGAVFCFGANGLGELGRGNSTPLGSSSGDAAAAVPVDVDGPVKSISAGWRFNCALLADGRVKCWGYNADGQLGLGDTAARGDNANEMGSNLPAVDLGDGRRAVQITTGRNFACAILDNGSLKCWGGNNNGQLGIGAATSANIGDAPGEMGTNLSTVNLGAGKTAVSIDSDAEASHVCAILNDYSLKCWGWGSQGQLGLGNSTSLSNPSATAIDLGAGLTAMQVAVGAFHTCAVTSVGTVKCWGLNSSGQLGYGDTTWRGDSANEMGSNLAAIDIGGDNTAMSIAAGYQSTCALRSDAQTVCWGDNALGALGISNTSLKIGDGANEMGSNLAVTVSSNSVSLFVGAYSGCTVSETAALKCWGANINYQLGIDNSAHPVTTPTLSALDSRFSGTLYVQQIATGSDFACALFSGGNVRCWGSGADGRRGSGDNNTRGASAGEMQNLQDINFGAGKYAISISLDSYAACALMGDRSVMCWGFNSIGQLGLGNTSARNTPATVDVGTGLKVLAMETNGGTTCVVLTDRRAKCWGLNASGRLGVGDSTNRGGSAGQMGDNLPYVAQTSGTPWRVRQIVPGGGMHTCAVDTSGVAFCWGYNAYGELGQNSTSSSNRPVVVSLGSATARDIIPGTYLTCAILSDFRLFCWGRNDVGQLGIGSVGGNIGDAAGEMTGLAPINLGTYGSGLSAAAIAVSTREQQICAILSTGLTKCWGINTFGQLGLDNTQSKGGAASTMGDNLSTINLGSSVAATSVAVGANGACAALTNGRAKCWGNNGSGHLGRNNTLGAGAGGSTTPMSLLPTIRFQAQAPTLRLATASATSSTSSLTFTLTSDTDISCPSVTAADFTITNGTFVSATATNSAVCTIAVNSSVASPGSGTTTVTSSGSFSVTDLDSTVQNTLSAPTSVSVAVTLLTSQTASFGATGGNLPVGATRPVTATSTSNLPVTITSTTPSICTFGSGVVTAVSVGSCVLEANQAGDATYAPATAVQATIPIVKANQTISFTYSAGAISAGGPAVAAAATSTSGLPVTVTSTTTGVCTWAAGQVTPLTAGSCVLRGTQAGNSNFNAASPTDYTIAVGLGSQTVSFGATGGDLAIGATRPITASSTSGLAVAITSTTSTICTFSAGVVTAVRVGNCVLEANQSGDATYSAAAAVQTTIPVVKASQTISFSYTGGVLSFGDSPFNVSASATSGLLPVVTSTTQTVCTITSNTVTIVGVGDCILEATQAGDATYAAAPAVRVTISISKGNQTISVSGMPTSVKIGSDPFGIDAVATSMLAVTLTSSTPTICTVARGVVTIVAQAPGTCTIVASQDGDGSFASATSTSASINVLKGDQAPLSFAGSTTVGWLTSGKRIAIATTGGTGPGTVTANVTSTGTAGCSATATHVVAAGTGTCVVTFQRSPNAAYNAVSTRPVTLTFGATPQSVVITSPLPVQPESGDTFTLAAKSDSVFAASPVAFSVDPASRLVCDISSSFSPVTVTLKTRGACLITAIAPGLAGLTPSSPTPITIAVGARNQSINFATLSNSRLGDPDVALDARATSGLAVNYQTTTPEVCTVNTAGRLTMLSVGTCTIEANQAGDSRFANAVPVIRSFEVVPNTPTAPFITSVSATNSSIFVVFNAPGFDGGAPILNYSITATPTQAGTSVATSCSASPCRIGQLSNGTSYTVTVAATNSAGTGTPSTASRATTPADRPNAVEELAVAIDRTKLTVTWKAPASLNGGTFVRYAVTHRAAGDPWPTTSTQSVTSPSTLTTTITGIREQTPYDVKVVVITTVDGSELTSNSAEALGTPLTAPAAPVKVASLDGSSREIVVTWTEPITNGGSPVTSYAVRLSNGAACPRVEFDQSTRAGRCIIADPVPGATYEVSVSAVNAIGVGAPVVVSVSAPKSPTRDADVIDTALLRRPRDPGFVRVTPVAATDDAPARSRLAVSLDAVDSVTTVVFVVMIPGERGQTEHSATVRTGGTLAAVVVPRIDERAIVSAYARNRFGVSPGAPTDANLHRVELTPREIAVELRRRVGPTLRFDAASAVIKKEYWPALAEIASMYGSRDVVMHVTGYARGGGAPQNFLTFISMRRAQAVARFLSRRGAKIHIFYTGMGDGGKNPGIAADRRVVISVEPIQRDDHK